MDDEWQSVSDFTENLNNYYLETHESADISFPSIPSTADDKPVEEYEVFKLLTDINTHKATNSEDFPAWVSQNNAHILS